jgi:Fe-S oxidoreductase
MDILQPPHRPSDKIRSNFCGLTRLEKDFGSFVGKGFYHELILTLSRDTCQPFNSFKDQIRPIGMKAAYQRPCSNRLIPETLPLVDEIFKRVGVERVKRQYDGENALCGGGVLKAMQRDDQVEDLQKRNLDDMQASGAGLCVFNCPLCFFTLGEAAADRGMMPLLMSELCQQALGEKMILGG